MSGPDTGREALLINAFVGLADTLVDDYDVIDVLDRLAGYSVQLLAAESVGILLADAQATLRVVASTNEQTEWMELLQLQAEEGPCVDCYRTGVPVSVTDLADAALRWPRFIAALTQRGTYGSVHALPLRLRGRAIGALNLFTGAPVHFLSRTSPWDRRWRTWRRSASCRSGRSGTGRCSTSGCRSRSTAASSSNRPRAPWPSTPGWPRP